MARFGVVHCRACRIEVGVPSTLPDSVKKFTRCLIMSTLKHAIMMELYLYRVKCSGSG